MRLLSEAKKGLPASWYYDPEQYSRELKAVWYRDWVCIGRVEDLPQPGDYLVASIGTQSIIVTLAGDRDLKAFHNTCRHRGSVLCANERGRFRNERIICPYHTWIYSTTGELLDTPGRIATDDFENSNYSLYSVHVDVWRGYIFVNLADEPATGLIEFLGAEMDYLRNWPLEDMRSVHREVMPVACNWKMFWENYNECYHCPRVHPELCKVMPIYKKAVFDDVDVPGWQPAFEGDSGMAGVGEGARTWAVNGQSSLPNIAGLTQEEIDMGVIFSSVPGSMYVVGHPDYVRTVRIIPTGPESIDLVVDWLLPNDCDAQNEAGISAIVEFVKLVVEQDGKVCELNQNGVHSDRHEAGVLVPQEFELWNFHEWLREKLAAADA
ncbi:MAG: aromatic ring-hydroxylating oxygenase subunit alpha [Woeseiaceae bacterium]